MFRRLFFILALALPVGALAADAPSSNIQDTGQTTVSPQSSSLLQPATGASSPLQSADAGTAGVTPTSTQNLQQTGQSDQAKLLIQGDADQPHDLSSGPNLNWLLYILAVCVATTVLTALLAWWQGRRLTQQSSN